MCYNMRIVEKVGMFRRHRHIFGREGNAMPLKYKINILSTLKEKGYNTNRLRKEKLLAESTIQKLREYKPISWANIAQICEMLNCQPGDLMEYFPEADVSKKG